MPLYNIFAMPEIVQWVYSKFGDWVADRINGILWTWVGVTVIQAFNSFGWYNATLAIMQIQQASDVLDWVWYIDTIGSFISLILWFFRKLFGQYL